MGLITIIGAGPGISYGVAQRFGREGYTIALIARREEKLQQLVEELRQEGIRALYAVADVGQEDALRQALQQIHTAEGESDMILYNAVGWKPQDIFEMDWEAVKLTLDTSVGGFLHLVKAVLPAYIERNSGKLFVTGGGLALQGDPNYAALGMGKAALRNLVQACVRRAAGTGVHIAQLIVCGYVKPGNNKYNPTDIAEEYWRLFQQKPGEFEYEIVY